MANRAWEDASFTKIGLPNKYTAPNVFALMFGIGKFLGYVN